MTLPVTAQTFRMDPAAALTSAGVAITYDLTATPGTVFSILADLSGGPVDLFGERLYLGFSPTITTLQAGTVPAAGLVAGTITAPPIAGMLGLAVYGQGVVIDSAAPNSLFSGTNAESSVIYGTPFALTVDFDDPATAGFTGNYSQSIAGHISGGAVTYRTHETIAPQGLAFPLPLQNPLNPDGCREQMVFRAQDVGATGDPELITAIRWYSATGLMTDSFQQIELAVGHTPVHPDYTVSNWTALPLFPSSGLDPTFVNNYVTGAPPQTVFQGSYDILPAMRRVDGYVPLPVITPFAYDGSSSLLLEFRVTADPTAHGLNGMYGQLMVQSSPMPAARNTAGGTSTQTVDPSQAIMGVGDNWMANLQVEFARVETNAQSPWLDCGQAAPDYTAPSIAASLPSGTSVQIEYRGSSSQTGVNPTAWSATPDIADGERYLQFRMTFLANQLSAEVPVVDTLVVPFN